MWCEETLNQLQETSEPQSSSPTAMSPEEEAAEEHAIAADLHCQEADGVDEEGADPSRTWPPKVEAERKFVSELNSQVNKYAAARTRTFERNAIENNSERWSTFKVYRPTIEGALLTFRQRDELLYTCKEDGSIKAKNPTARTVIGSWAFEEIAEGASCYTGMLFATWLRHCHAMDIILTV